MSIKNIRLIGWALIAFALFIVVLMLARQNAPVMIYKLALVTIAAVVAYYVDRSLYPYARPHTIKEPITAAAAQLRRAIIVGAFVIAVSIGL